MNEMLKQTLEELKNKVLENLECIRVNELEIKTIVIRADSEDKFIQLKSKFEENKELLNDNLNLLDAQYKIVGIINKYKPSSPVQKKEYSKKEIADCYNATIIGVIAFNEEHPFFNDVDFVEKLINFYTSNEQYEECARLSEMKGL